MAEKKKDKSPKEPRVIPIEWILDPGLETTYVNTIRVTHGGRFEFYIYFGEVTFPPIIADEKIPDKIEVHPKIRLAVTPEKMEEIVEVLTTNLENYKKMVKEDAS